MEGSLITTKCEYYNHTLCQDTGKGCNETEYCGVAEPNKRNHCFVLWQNSSAGELQIKFKVVDFILKCEILLPNLSNSFPH